MAGSNVSVTAPLSDPRLSGSGVTDTPIALPTRAPRNAPTCEAPSPARLSTRIRVFGPSVNAPAPSTMRTGRGVSGGLGRELGGWGAAAASPGDAPPPARA